MPSSFPLVLDFLMSVPACLPVCCTLYLLTCVRVRSTYLVSALISDTELRKTVVLS